MSYDLKILNDMIDCTHLRFVKSNWAMKLKKLIIFEMGEWTQGWNKAKMILLQSKHVISIITKKIVKIIISLVESYKHLHWLFKDKLKWIISTHLHCTRWLF